jgi:hypothetical protein
METLVDLSDPARIITKGSTTVQSTSPNTILKLHASTCNQQDSSPESSSLALQAVTPRYMTPTIASMSQASTTSAAQAETRNTTPAQGSLPLKTAKGRNWLATAMSLSGIGRSSDGAPRDKKEQVVSRSSVNANDHRSSGIAQLKQLCKVSQAYLSHLNV